MTSDKIVIPLEKYGMKGEVIMAYPGYKKAQIAEARALNLSVKYVDGEQQIDLEKGYFAALEKASVFIEAAPIKIDGYESVLDLLDMAEESCTGAGEDLLEQILTASKEIAEGRKSPFAKSPGAVTERSG